MDFLGPQIFDLFGIVIAKVGRPLQRRRAERLAQRGRVNCVLFEPTNDSILRTRVVTGAVQPFPGKVRYWKTEDLWISGVDLPGEPGPGERRSDSDLWFRPQTQILTLHTSGGGTVKMAILAWQAQWVVEQLGLISEPTRP